MNEAELVLKPGRDKAVRHRHHWIFSGAVGTYPRAEEGSVVLVRAADGAKLGRAHFRHGKSIVARMLTFDDTPVSEAIPQALRSAAALRKALITPDTTAYRLVNGEGDGLPGLVVDVYGDTAVLQISTAGMDRMKKELTGWVAEAAGVSQVYERSDMPGRGEEGLKPVKGWLMGEGPTVLEVSEYGLKFQVDVARGQKTGFFLDQREMRALVRRHAAGRSVLNCFAYTGGFSVAALAGGAKKADSVDLSEDAIAMARENVKRNGFSEKKAGFVNHDVFEFLRSADLSEYDFIVLDPPAFTKRKDDVIRACRGYKDINRLALKGIAPGGLLLTSSCSYHVEPALFQTVVFQAALEAGRNVRIVQRHHLAADHPINLYHPEGEYLKSLLLYVE